MDKEDVVYIHNGILLSYKKRMKPYPLSTTWTNLEGMMLSKMSDRERQILYDFTYMWNLKKRNK